MKFLVVLSWATAVLSAPPTRRPWSIRQPLLPPSSLPSPPPFPTGIPSFPTAPTVPLPGSCNSAGLLNITQPIAPTPLPPPGDGNILAAIVVGRGVQNYTCSANSTAAPVQLGAVATLYEASCAAAANPNLLSTISQEAFDVPVLPGKVALPFLPCRSAPLRRAGQHYFSASGVPTFDLTGDGSLGLAMVSKGKTSPSPAGASAVAWLELLKADGTTGPITKMYRLSTVGGSPPATCEGQPGVISVQYAAQYWVYTAAS